MVAASVLVLAGSTDPNSWIKVCWLTLPTYNPTVIGPYASSVAGAVSALFSHLIGQDWPPVHSVAATGAVMKMEAEATEAIAPRATIWESMVVMVLKE
jgi:hypothetical protein